MGVLFRAHANTVCVLILAKARCQWRQQPAERVTLRRFARHTPGEQAKVRAQQLDRHIRLTASSALVSPLATGDWPSSTISLRQLGGSDDCRLSVSALHSCDTNSTLAFHGPPSSRARAIQSHHCSRDYTQSRSTCDCPVATGTVCVGGSRDQPRR